jgi:hypothetical protein
MEHDEYDISDVMSASELYEDDRATEFRLDAEDDARNTAAIEAEEAADEAEAAADDGEPWEGLADGEER